MPAEGASVTTVAEPVQAWHDAASADSEFADDLERVGALGEPPDDA